MGQIELTEPLWLWLALIPSLLLLVGQALRYHRRQDYAQAHLLEWVVVKQKAVNRENLLRFVFLQLAWILFAVALAAPRSQISLQQTTQEHYRELVVVVDVSRSMSSRDNLPDRIERSKLEMLDLVDQMQDTRMAIVVFAARAHLLTPLTADKSALRHYISTIKTQWLATEGSRLFDALQFAQHHFHSTTVSQSLLLVSDGEQHLDASELTQARTQLSSQLRQHGRQLYALGMGTAAGAPVLAGSQAWLTYQHQAVISQQNVAQLEELAALGNGRYAAASNDNHDWQILYHQGIARNNQNQTAQINSELTQWQDHFTGYLLAAFSFFMLAIIPLPLIRLKPIKAVATNSLQTVLILASCVFVLTGHPPAFARDMQPMVEKYSDDDLAMYRKAQRHYLAGELDSALILFRKLPGYHARFAEGVVYYQQQDYSQAIPRFIQAILDANSSEQRQAAIFNLANSYYRLEQYPQASELYRDVLRYNPAHTGAQINLSYAIALTKKPSGPPTEAGKRQGNGPAMQDVEAGLEITGRVAISESESTEQNPITDSRKTDSQDSGVFQKDSHIASQDIKRTDDPQWTYDITHLDELKRQQPVIDIDESVFWQRLFETEEGFDAPQETTHTLPGVKPW